MSVTVFGLSVIVAIVTAIRSIWSPCGLSMLSTITPVAEVGRGHRFRSTALWFVVGSIAGGITLGGLMAGVAVLVSRVATSADAVLGIIAAAALVASASDGRVGGFHLPGHERQVNERWLDRYRSWVYGAGFGWQIGVGLATYIMTAGIYLLILIGGLTGNPLAAIGLGALFGLVRGLSVYLAAGLDSTDKLLGFHARFESMREPVRRATIVIEALVGISAATAAGASPSVLALFVAAAGVIVAASIKGPREAVYLNATAPAA